MPEIIREDDITRILARVTVTGGDPVGDDDLARKAYVDGHMGGVVWGAITGTLSDQTDLQAELDAKANVASGSAGRILIGDKQGNPESSGIQITVDGSLSQNSDLRMPTEQAVKTYIDGTGLFQAMPFNNTPYQAVDFVNDTVVPLFTVPDGKIFIPTSALWLSYVATDATVDPSVSLGITGPDYADWLPITVLTGLINPGESVFYLPANTPVNSGFPAYPAGTIFSMNITTPAVATALTGIVIIYGVLLPATP